MLEDKDELPKTFVITLVEEPWKGKACEAHLRELGLQATFLAGFHGPSMGLAPLVPYRRTENGENFYAPTPAIGMALSHLHALRVGILSAKEEFIVCEDDVCFPPDIVTRFWESKTWWPKSVEVVQLAYNGHADKPQKRVNEGFLRCYYPFGTTCVWWSVAGAAKAIQMFKPVCDSADIGFMTKVYPFLEHGIPAEPLARDRTMSGEWPSSSIIGAVR